jgi:hypothetical protein
MSFDEPKFIHPFTCLVSGPTQAGKTVFTFRLINAANEMIHPPPEKFIYCFTEYQPLFEKYPKVLFHEGLPDTHEIDGKVRTLLILDDLMSQQNTLVSDLFTKISHHRNVSVIFLTQNLFYKSQHNRTMSINSQYLVLTKNPRDASQIGVLARQMYPEKAKFLIDAFRNATEKPHSYLLIDLKQSCPDKIRIRTDIFPDDDAIRVYIPK